VSWQDEAEEYDLRKEVGDFEKKIIVKVLNNCQWQRKKAADVLKISRKTLFRKMKIYGLR
jgi:DNA-binding NtrC family response regulator